MESLSTRLSPLGKHQGWPATLMWPGACLFISIHHPAANGLPLKECIANFPFKASTEDNA